MHSRRIRHRWPGSLTYGGIVNNPSISLKLQLFGVSMSTVTYMLSNPKSLEGLSREDKRNVIWFIF